MLTNETNVSLWSKTFILSKWSPYAMRVYVRLRLFAYLNDQTKWNVCCAAGLFIIIWSGWHSCTSGVNIDPEATREHYWSHRQTFNRLPYKNQTITAAAVSVPPNYPEWVLYFVVRRCVPCSCFFIGSQLHQWTRASWISSV